MQREGSVDTVDKKTENGARQCMCWPLVVFYSMANIGGLNAQIICQENTTIIKKKKTRLEFM